MRIFLKSYLNYLFVACCLFALIFFNGCKDANDKNNKNSKNSVDNYLIVGVSADYPPFEFIQNGEFKGLDIDLANLIGKFLNRKIIFKDLSYSNLFPALNSGQIDMAISTITFTEARNKNFDLSKPYYWANIAIIFRKDQPIERLVDLHDKKIGAQLGSTMEMWVKNYGQNTKLVSMDISLQLIEALKSKQLDVVVFEEVQAKEFCKINQELGYLVVAKSNNGYVVALKRGSKLLLEQVNDALDNIKNLGDLNKLKNKWLDLLFETEVHDAS